MVFKFQEFINEESSRAPLYHAISFNRCKEALDKNSLDCYSFQRTWPDGKRLKDDQDGYYDSQYLRGISLTRDFEYAKGWNEIVFEFDQDKLKQKWKVVPYNWGYSIGKGYIQSHRMKREREEFLIIGITDELNINKPVGSIKPLDRYLTGFWIDNNMLSRNNDDVNSLTEHPLFCGFFKSKSK